MQFRFIAIDSLPRLSWCATLRRGEATVEVHHGPWVEVHERWFCEGAWDGDFASGQLAEAIVIGSGGQLTEAGVLFAAPNHTVERLHLIELPEAVLVSNSLSFVLCQANDALDADYSFYRQDLQSVIHGLKKYVRSMPTHQGRRLAVYYHCNLTLNVQGQITETPKKPAPEFADFAAYNTFLLETVQALHRNATDAKRQLRYTPIASISSGYDSPAAAVLARSVGCREALTFSTSRQIKETDWAVQSDSGVKIARQLGMRVTEYQRQDYLHVPGFPEAEFFACGPNGADAVMLPWAKHLEQRLLFSGFHGDKVWDINNPKVSPDIVRGDPSGSTLAEFRLRVASCICRCPFWAAPATRRLTVLGMPTRCAPGVWAMTMIAPSRGVWWRRRALSASGSGRRSGPSPCLCSALNCKAMNWGQVSLRDFLAFYRDHRSAFEWWRMVAIRGFYRWYLRSAPGLNKVLPWLGVTHLAPLVIPPSCAMSAGEYAMVRKPCSINGPLKGSSHATRSPGPAQESRTPRCFLVSTLDLPGMSPPGRPSSRPMPPGSGWR